MKNWIESLMIKETTHSGNIIRRDLNLLTIFNVLYLVVSEKSVTHNKLTSFIYFRVYARAKRVVTIDCKEIPK